MANETKPQGVTQGGKPGSEKKANPWILLFGAPIFNAAKPGKPFVFPSGADAGTKQYALAEVMFPKFGECIGMEGATAPHYRVVMRESPDGKTRILAMTSPSVAIGPVKHPIINVKNASEHTISTQGEWQNSVLSAFMLWRKEQQATGKAVAPSAAVASAGARELTAADLKEMGLTLEEPAA